METLDCTEAKCQQGIPLKCMLLAQGERSGGSENERETPIYILKKYFHVKSKSKTPKHNIHICQ